MGLMGLMGLMGYNFSLWREIKTKEKRIKISRFKVQRFYRFNGLRGLIY